MPFEFLFVCLLYICFVGVISAGYLTVYLEFILKSIIILNKRKKKSE